MRLDGLTIEKNGQTILTTETKTITGLIQPVYPRSFVSTRGLAQHIGVCTRPYVFAGVHITAHGTEPTTENEIRPFRKAIDWIKEANNDGFRFKHLQMDSERIVLIRDSAFENARGYRSQLGYVVLLTNHTDTANIIHLQSNRFKRETSSVLPA